MTDNERLAAIEARANGRNTNMADDVRWLIAELRQRDAEYARGREDERKAVVAWMTAKGDKRDCQSIKDGEHAQ